MSPADAPTETAVEEAPEVVTDDLRDGVVARLGELLGDQLIDHVVVPGHDLTVRVTNEAWAHTAELLRNVMGARYFCFISAIDWKPSPYGRYMDAEVDKVLAGNAAGTEDVAAGPFPTGVAGGDTRFQVLARLTNVKDHWGITVKADTSSDEDPRIATWTKVFAGADWHERETWEMFGISFDGHPHLRNIYLPSEFEGNPLRKDFPLLARIVKPWPGIVDVEPMPSSGEETPDAEASDEESA